MKKTALLAALALATLIVPASLSARTKLTALPDRARTVVSLENPNETLVYEERLVPLQQGANFIDFSWQNVSIDPQSVMLEFVDPTADPDAAPRTISTGYPPNESALTWQIFAPEADAARVRVSYVLRGISWSSFYDLYVNQEETVGDFQQYIILGNQSGESFDSAILRFPLMEDIEREFESGETRRFLAERAREAAVEKLYILQTQWNNFRSGEDPEPISLIYRLENNEQAGLGERALAPGKVRIFGDDGTGSTIFLGEDVMQQVPRDGDAEVTLGSVQDVVVRRRLMGEERTEVVRNSSRDMVKWDLNRRLRYEIENFSDRPITLEIREATRGDWSISEITEDGVTTERESIDQLVIRVELPAREAGEETEPKVVDLELLIENVLPQDGL